VKKVSSDDKDFWTRTTAGTKPIAHDTVTCKREEAPPKINISINSIMSEDLARYRRMGSVDYKTGVFAAGHGNQSLGVEQVSKRQKRKITPEGMIDLHGMSQSQAFDQLQRFLYIGQLQGKTWVKIITGKSGVLRSSVPVMLQQMSNLVSGITESKPKDGGEGALYVRLRNIHRGTNGCGLEI
jgi:DNA-nicking Smr family endonuclease